MVRYGHRALDESDAIVVEMGPEGGGRLKLEVPAGDGEARLAEILKSETQWIDVGAGRHVNRDMVQWIELQRASDPPRSFVSSV